MTKSCPRNQRESIFVFKGVGVLGKSDNRGKFAPEDDRNFRRWLFSELVTIRVRTIELAFGRDDDFVDQGPEYFARLEADAGIVQGLL